MKIWIVLFALFALAACVDSVDLGLVEVRPEKKICMDTSRVIGTERYIIQVDTVECDGGFGVRWK